MKKLLLIFFFLSFIVSCSIEKKLAKYCPLCTQKDSTVTVIQYKDTTIEIPGETVFIEDTLFCDSLGNVYASRLSEKDGTILKLQARIKNNKYKVIAKTDTIYKLIPGNTIYKTKLVTKTQKPQKIKYTPGILIFLGWSGGIFWLLIILYIIYRIVLNKLNRI
jgi:hypothetical protein